MSKKLFPKVSLLHNATKTHNSESVFQPIGKPAVVSSCSATPFFALDEASILSNSADGLATVSLEKPDAMTPVASFPGRCACSVANGKTVVVSPNGPVTVVRLPNGRWALNHEPATIFNPVSIIAQPMSPLEFSVPALSLSRSYYPADALSPVDSAKVIQSVSGAYQALATTAAEQGVFFQPVIVRAVLKDADNNTVWHGPELLVMPPDGVLPFDSPINLEMPSPDSTALTRSLIPSFALRVSASPMANLMAVKLAASLHIEISPAFHPFSTEFKAADGLVAVNRSSSSSQRLAVSLPGAARGLSSASEAARRNFALVNAVLASFNRMAVSLPVASNPFDKGVDQIVRAFGLPSLTAQCAKIEAACNNPAAASLQIPLTLHRFNAPHSFSAAVCAAAHSAVVFGDMEAVLYPGYSPADYASELSSSPAQWKAVTTVSFSDGSSSSRVSSGTGNCPSALNPLVVYPDPAATSVSVCLQVGDSDSVAVWHADLAPDFSGLRAIGFLENLSQRLPEYKAQNLPDDAATSHAPHILYPQCVAVATSVNPFRISAVADLGARVSALTVASSSSAAWDYGRTRFYAFSPQSLSILNIDRDFSYIALGRLAQVGVNAQCAVATSSSATIFFVGSNGSVYSVNGRRVNAVAKLPQYVDCLGFDPDVNQIQAAASSGRGSVFHLDCQSGAVLMSSSSPGPLDSFLLVGNSLFCSTQNCGLINVSLSSRLDFSGSTDIRLIFRLDPDKTPVDRFIRGVLWNLSAKSFNGFLSLSRSALSYTHTETTNLRIKGRVNSKVPMPAVCRPFNSIVLEINAEVSADARILLPALIF